MCELSENKKKAKYVPPTTPQFCTRDVDCRFCGAGAWISRSENTFVLDIVIAIFVNY